MQEPHLVLLTACIDPTTGPGAKDVYRVDPRVRLADYQDGLRFWLHLEDARLSTILFVENSGYPLDALQAIVERENHLAKRVDFLYVDCNNYPPNLHYGYAELGMLDAAMQRYLLPRGIAYFVKANGRLRFPELPRLLDRIPPRYSFAVDARSHYGLRGATHSYITTQLMLFSTEFYREHVLGRRDELAGPTGHLEDFFYNALLPFRGSSQALLRWPINVSTIGEAAHWPKAYHSPRQRAVNVVRAGLRRLAPDLWI